ncbi:cytochrome P450 [Ophiobolus disseminans]|uniref:Cytochrome P450 n=1 Tax=Ophiobolus disseminans TaxID=1469910 RepID=A0A6A6ZEK2_9PLEO|nr:cytochrome P450 [Ophiobolus disseminans]
MNYQENNATNTRSNSFIYSTAVSTPARAYPYLFFTIACLLLASIVQHVKALLTHAKRRSRLPPGPWGFPLIGSVFSIGLFPERTLDRWARKYGPLYSVTMGKELFIVLSSPDVVKDLVITNGNVFSDRQVNIRNHEVFAGRGVTATHYGDEHWRKHRRLSSVWLNQKAVDRYTHVLDFEATDMLKALYADSKNGTVALSPQTYEGRCALNNMLTIVLGTRTTSIHDPFIKTALRIAREFMNVSAPMSNLVDFVPLFLKKAFPWSLKLRGEKLHRDMMKLYGTMIDEIAATMASGTDVPDSLVKYLLSVRDAEALTDSDIKLLVCAFMIGGVETTASVMQWFTALIPSYPDVQRKAQDELDRVVGRGRLPTVADEANLPYVHAIIKEVERCFNPIWLGTPHATSQDFEYEGKLIPKGATVVLNTWSMQHSPDRWDRPLEFDPERYTSDPLLSSASVNSADPNARDHWMFGAGRRVCPGMLLAEREIFLVVSRLLWAFDMQEFEGRRTDLNRYDGLSARSPVPFVMRLTPRFEGVGEVLGRVG